LSFTGSINEDLLLHWKFNFKLKQLSTNNACQ
jgi:hypothetical protein